MIAARKYTMQSRHGKRIAHCLITCLLFFFLAVLSGCVEVKDNLIINADGSGSVEIEAFSYLPPSADVVSMFRLNGDGLPPETNYPPLSVSSAQVLFPKQYFEYELLQVKEKEGDPDLHLKVSFKDVNQLLASPYGKAHELQLEIKNNRLTFAAFSGLQSLADETFWLKQHSQVGRFIPIDLGQIKKLADKLHVDFSLSMPSPMNIPNVQGRQQSHTWSLQGPVAQPDAPSLPGLDTEIVADCPADSITFKPDGPMRLGHYNFADIPEKKSKGEGSNIDDNTLSSMLHFVPISLTTHLAFDYWGEETYDYDMSSLIGALSMPDDHAPSHWGKGEITEVTDNLGNDLLPFEDFRQINQMSQLNDNREIKNEQDGKTYHFVEIRFQSPVSGATHLETIRGAIDLQYEGINSVYKLAEMIPEGSISSGEEDYIKLFGGFDKSIIRQETLPDNGPALTVLGCIRIEGMTVIGLEMQGAGSRISSLHLYDKAGQHWPGFFFPIPGEEGKYLFMGMGEPQGPLSLGFTLNQGPVIKAGVTIKNLQLNHDEIPKQKS